MPSGLLRLAKMKRVSLILAFAIYGFASADLVAEEKSETVEVSPSGAWEIENVPQISSPGNDDVTPDLWVVSTADRSQRARLPKQSPDSPTDDEFHFSPNEEWLFGLRHGGSGLRDGRLYHLMKPLRLEAVGKENDFNRLVWEKAVKLGVTKRNFSSEGVYAMTFFDGWSGDSSRLLLKLCGGDEKRDMRCGFIYFNTRLNDFETTDYSRKLRQAKFTGLTCAEPVDPLPAEAELKRSSRRSMSS
jgi:hypothetical protein